MTKVHDLDHGDEEPSEPPKTDLDNYYTEDLYPKQDSDIEELIESHGNYFAKMAFTYHISKHSASSYGSLVDRGTNGGLAGAHVHVLERTGTKVSVTRNNEHELPGLDIITCVALVHTNHGKIIMIMHEYAYYAGGNTIHSPSQT